MVNERYVLIFVSLLAQMRRRENLHEDCVRLTFTMQIFRNRI